jgi:hypothetical protein
MAYTAARDSHLVKKALAIAVYVMERQVGTFQSPDDILDMKLLLERLTDGPEMDYYLHAARIAVTGASPPSA